MGLLNRIQEKNKQIGGKSKSDDSSSEIHASSSTLEIRKVFREQSTLEKSKENTKIRKTDKHQELKNVLHKKIIQELKEQDIEAIIPKLDRLAVEIIKEDEEFRGQIDRKKVVDELINDLTGFGPINPLLLDEDV